MAPPQRPLLLEGATGSPESRVEGVAALSHGDKCSENQDKMSKKSKIQVQKCFMFRLLPRQH